MKQNWNLFCKTLRMPYWKQAQKIWTKLESTGFPQPLLKANTKELYTNAFNFNSIATNDDVVAILSDLDTAQSNLNMNSNNEVLIRKFIAAAQEASKELTSKYKDFWHDPAVGALRDPKTASLVEKKNDDDSDDE